MQRTHGYNHNISSASTFICLHLVQVQASYSWLEKKKKASKEPNEIPGSIKTGFLGHLSEANIKWILISEEIKKEAKQSDKVIESGKAFSIFSHW